jgi:hypothetical protein
MKIPEVSKRMREIAELIQYEHPNESAELLELAGELKRRFSGPRAPASSTPITPELYEEIRERIV